MKIDVFFDGCIFFLAGPDNQAAVERMTQEQEQAERVASFRRMDAILISARGKKPYLDTLGIPRFPPDCEPKYRHWEGGQPLLDTLLELGASDRAINMRVTMERSAEVK
jgi:hypothetical protein